MRRRGAAAPHPWVLGPSKEIPRESGGIFPNKRFNCRLVPQTKVRLPQPRAGFQIQTWGRWSKPMLKAFSGVCVWRRRSKHIFSMLNPHVVWFVGSMECNHTHTHTQRDSYSIYCVMLLILAINMILSSPTSKLSKPMMNFFCFSILGLE